MFNRLSLFISTGLPLFCFALLGAVGVASATEVPLVGDAHVNSTATTTNYGSVSNLYVGNGNTAYVQFDTTQLPAGTTGAQVTRATLLVFVNRVNTSGTVTLNALTSGFAESTVTYGTRPSASAATLASFSATTAGVYVPVDVTSAVQGWVTTPASNYGLQLTAASANVLLDSKENDQTAHPAKLEISLASGTTLSSGTAAGQVYLTGASGAVPTAPVSVAGDATLSSTGTLTVAGGAITGSKIANLTIESINIDNSAVTTSNIAPNAVTIPKLPAGATATTFLRGDGTWVTPTATSVPPQTFNHYQFENGNTTTVYFYPTSGLTNATFNQNALDYVPNACTLGNIKVSGILYYTGIAATSTFTVYKNASISGTAGTVVGGAQIGSCTVNEPSGTSSAVVGCTIPLGVAFAAGDDYYIAYTSTNQTNSPYIDYNFTASCQ